MDCTRTSLHHSWQVGYHQSPRLPPILFHGGEAITSKIEHLDLFFKIIFQSHCNIVKLMSSLWISESIQEKVLKVLSTNLASLMVV